MQLDEGLDTGPMLLERRRSIGPDDTAGDLHDALAPLGAAALLEAIAGLAAGTLTGRAQPAVGATYAAKLEKSEALIDWNRDAVQIDRQIRRSIPGRLPRRAWAVNPCVSCVRVCSKATAAQPRPALC
jgi:methionyl-tRNA formyltransferase